MNDELSLSLALDFKLLKFTAWFASENTHSQLNSVFHDHSGRNLFYGFVGFAKQTIRC